MDNRFKGQAFGLLAATFLMWGGVHVAGRLISDAVPAPLLACLRCCCAMLPLLWMSRGCLGRVHLDRADWKYFAAVGLLGYFLTIFCIQIGISLTGASMAALLNALTPVSVTLLAALVLKEPITPVKVACLILALAGPPSSPWGPAPRGSCWGFWPWSSPSSPGGWPPCICTASPPSIPPSWSPPMEWPSA